MSVSFSNAINAYNSAARSVREGNAQPAEEAGQGSAFASLVKDSLREARDLGTKSEEIQMQAVNGQADMRDVVMAVANAEMALDTVVTIRDRVLSAYQEILKMPI
ncbi:MAG: flagellar hook-basal body complex protein FliE [Caenispirillum bisanense]|nr:flagellar hook-basal body complex protein FliE [Caenispirillum bisanense]MCA1973846.1 flagellar hook-basal body complex protein FliE [Caenispirillum sp.]